MRINFYLLRTFCSHLGSFLCCFFFHYVSAKFHLWPSSGDSPRPQIGMLSLVTASPVITSFHIFVYRTTFFDQVNLSPDWVGFETMTMLNWNRRDSTPLSAAPRAPKGEQGWIFWSYKSLSGLPESGPYRIFVLVFNWNHFEMRLLNLRIYIYIYIYIYVMSNN